MYSSATINLFLLLLATVILRANGQWEFPEEQESEGANSGSVDEKYPWRPQRPEGQRPPPQQPQRPQRPPINPGGQPPPFPQQPPVNPNPPPTNPGQQPDPTQIDVPNAPSIITTVPCNCPYVNNFNPVCGTNGKSYGNEMILKCHARCGVNVEVQKLGPCSANRS